jgi:hypothetical protein
MGRRKMNTQTLEATAKIWHGLLAIDDDLAGPAPYFTNSLRIVCNSVFRFAVVFG